ncbi:MAG TPA: DUF3105 domain-containing protein, partial [Chloroflexota bacterium]|nr:DUF3105 domain-containing protein [Chloroflexota bacterium]
MIGEPSGPAGLSVNMRMKVVGPQAIEPIARVFQVLFTPILLIPVLVVVAVAHWWLYVVHGGVMQSFIQVMYTPWLALPVLALTLIAGVFHEFGHAAALRYGGGRARGMGVGIYLIFPAFYTDTTETYRLGRWARVRTSLGGFYFHLIFALGIIGLYLVTGQEFVLLIVLLINVDIIRQSLPFVRFDGYWALADLTGIPDFFSQMGAFVRSIVPVPRWKGSKLPNLKLWVKAVFIIYILTTVPVLVFLFYWLVRELPRLTLTALDSMRALAEAFAVARDMGEILLMVAYAMQMLFLALQLLAPPYLLYVWARGPVRAGWRWSATTPIRRAVGSSLGVALIVLVTLVWWPQVRPTPASSPAGVQSFSISVEDRAHVQHPVAYPQTPPVGGDHAPIWQNCGFYDTVIGSEAAVHSMEHGAVWITYRPTLPVEQIEALRRLTAGRTHVLVSPYPELPAPVVASAWGRQLRLESATDTRLGQFVRVFQHGEQAPERGGP